MTTKKTDRARAWMLTLWEDQGHTKEVIEAALEPYSYIGQLEKAPETGKLHWQVYVEHSNQVRFETLAKKLPGGHFEARRGARAAAIRYVSKEDTFAGERILKGTFDIDTPAMSGLETAVRSAVLVEGKTPAEVFLTVPGAADKSQMVREIYAAQQAEAHSKTLRDVSAVYRWGATGVGKTFGIRVKDGQIDETVYAIDDWANPWDAYAGQSTLLLDEYAGQIPLQLLLKVLDCYPLELRRRYANTYAGWSKVFIVANVPLLEQYREQQANNPEAFRALVRRFTGIEQQVSRYERVDEMSVVRERVGLVAAV